MPTVLIIDDSEFDRRMIMTAMKFACDNLKCVELSKGERALETMRSESPSLTILDIRMPGMSGWDVLEQIKSDDVLRGLNVVMMSGSHSVGDIKMAETKGADGFYTKPHKKSDYIVVADDMRRTYINIAA
jgi:two-component system phosphate regulon response regulator PhoB